MSCNNLKDYTRDEVQGKYGHDFIDSMELGLGIIKVRGSSISNYQSREVKVDIVFISNGLTGTKNCTNIIAKLIEPGIHENYLILYYNGNEQIFKNSIECVTDVEVTILELQELLNESKINHRLTKEDLMELPERIISTEELDCYFLGRESVGWTKKDLSILNAKVK